MPNIATFTTVGTITTINSNTMKRPMSTSIIPSLSLDSRSSISAPKRSSTPLQSSKPKRPSSTSQAALATSQSQVGQNLLNRLSSQNANRASYPSSLSLVIVRDFGFPSTDPRHHGQGLPQSNKNKRSLTPIRSSFSKTHSMTGYQPQSYSRLITYLPCDSDDDDKSEVVKAQAELDKLIQTNQANSPILSASQDNSARGLIECGEVLPKLISKYDDLYVSLYDFSAEGESEMNLTKGELVKVLEIICDGWVVARKIQLSIDDDGKLYNQDMPMFLEDLESFSIPPDDANDLNLTGLCPENYLLKIS